MAKTFSKDEVLAAIYGLEARLKGMDEDDPESVRLVASYAARELSVLVAPRNRWAVQKCAQCGKEQWGRELHPFCSEECANVYAKQRREDEALGRGRD